MKKISVLVPCYNEEKNVEKMSSVLCDILDTYKGKYDYEIIFTDNSSKDNTKEKLRKIASENSKIKAIFNARNYGIDGRSSKYTGQYAKGDVVIGLPCDFQEPPELIPEFIRLWEQGNKIVCGRKTDSEEGKLRYTVRTLYYKIIDAMSETPQYYHISGIFLLDIEIWKMFLNTDYDFKLRHFLADIGYPVTFISYKQKKREGGKSSYSVARYFEYAINSLINTSIKPWHIISVFGLFGSFFSLLIFIWGIVACIFELYGFNLNTVILLLIVFILFITILFIGILGEYVGGTLQKIKKMPPVCTEDFLNQDE